MAERAKKIETKEVSATALAEASHILVEHSTDLIHANSRLMSKIELYEAIFVKIGQTLEKIAEGKSGKEEDELIELIELTKSV